MTPSQVATLLPNTSVDSVRRWIRNGALPARVLPNDRYLIRRSDLDSLMQPAHAPTHPPTRTSYDVLPGQPVLSWPSSESLAGGGR
ncbi:helix-turn-helix domain-containing protein [Actinomyces bovis]|uniref:helix-turn-helix domain-containing protein n=1 Tax=Actinomyces bovis TaxID=1658 RepID=UPI00389926EE